MKTCNEHGVLRELLINKVLNLSSSFKPSKTVLNKMSDEELVSSLYENSVEAEKQFWREDLIKRIVEFEPGTASKYKNSGTGLITSLVRVVQENTRN